MIQRFVSSKLTTVNKEYADFLLNNNYWKNRKIVNTNVSRFEDKMRSGQFQPFEQIRLVQLEDDTIVLMDAQHRLTAISNTGMSQEFNILTVTTDNIDEVYALTDNTGQMRTLVDSLRALDALKSMPETHAKKVISALRMMATNYPFTTLTAKQGTEEQRYANKQWQGSGNGPYVAEKLEGIGPSVASYFQTMDSIPLAYKDNRRDISLNVGFIAVALPCFREQAEMAKEFFGGLVSDRGLEDTDPRKVFVIKHASLIREKEKSNSRVPIHLIARYVMTAWNKYVAKKSIHQLHIDPHCVVKLDAIESLEL